MRAEPAVGRMPFAHDAVVEMPAEADPSAVGAAVTVALCGHWEHDPPCPLAPHHTDAAREAGTVRLRILFATDPETEDEVRARIDQALASGRLPSADSTTTRWELRSSAAGTVTAAEAAHVARLVAG